MTDSTLASQDWILPLDSAEASLTVAGGKGANLARLARASFGGACAGVPGGFLVTTGAYQAFLSANQLAERIRAALAEEGLPDDPARLEQVSRQIRDWFSIGEMPAGLADQLLAAYDRLGGPAVAVRSSATTEDLPGISFAGQQDTYLNVIGPEALLKAVVGCWSSLWTDRAISYRAHHAAALAQQPRTPHDAHDVPAGLAIAVVVQRMVEGRSPAAGVSGVLFTANPLTGLRTETVIDAIFGLGEALVSGQVEPDHYVVDTARGQIVARTLGAKAISVRGQAGGGTIVVEEHSPGSQALPDEQILALSQLGGQVAALYDFPQDIEWAWVDGAFYLLQSRPITSLFPLPAGMLRQTQSGGEPLQVMFSFGAVQGLLDPITPLGRDMMRLIFATGARLFVSKKRAIQITPATQAALCTAGERLWINITNPLRNSVGRRVVRAASEFIEPAIRQALDAIWDDPRLQPERAGIRFQTVRRLARFFLPLAGNVLLNLASPHARRQAIVARGERILVILRQRCEAITGDRRERLIQLAGVMPDLAREHLPRTLVAFISAVASGMASFNLLMQLSRDLPGDPTGSASQVDGQFRDDLVLNVTRGLPYNPTTTMDLALWEVARAVQRVARGDPSAWQEFQQASAAQLAERFQEGKLPPDVQQAFEKFLSTYGGRGLGEIDVGRPRWRENPAPIFEMVAGFLQIEEGDQSPDAVFTRSAAQAQAAVAQLAAAVRQSHLGWLKARLVRFAAGRTRALLGSRESPKFFAVRMLGVFRQALLDLGRDFVAAGELGQPDDLFYLSLAEMEAFAAGEARDWRAVIAQRRAAYRQEMQRRQVPRLLLSDGRAFYEGLSEPEGLGEAMLGAPVSPGLVEGRVRVVLDPRQADLLPGEILVCPGTDPSWTPLFLTAAGLVMEVGGMMTHGAVVAREYGIPAVVGVDRATQRLQTGQRVRLDGSTGRITLL